MNAVHPAQPGRLRRHYRRLLGWAFAGLGTLRVLSYGPTLVTIWQQRDSSQHSVLTWATWLGAHLTMAAWLHEQEAGAARGTVAVCLANALMCALTLGLVLAFR